MVQMERFSERVTFHVTPAMNERIDRIIIESGRPRSDALRLLMADAVQLYEGRMADAEEIGDVAGLTLETQLSTAKAEIKGLEEVNELLRERLGMADAQNIELNKRLESSLATVDRVTLALPAPAEGAGPTRRSWQFWRR